MNSMGPLSIYILRTYTYVLLAPGCSRATGKRKAGSITWLVQRSFSTPSAFVQDHPTSDSMERSSQFQLDPTTSDSMERSSQFQFQLDSRREDRLRRRRGYETRRCAAETAQQREARPARQRLRDRARRAAQSTAEVREVGFQQQRLASETREHRAARLRTISSRGWPLRHRRREQLVCCRL